MQYQEDEQYQQQAEGHMYEHRALTLPTALTLFPLDNYLRGKKEAQFEKDQSIPQRMLRMESLYAQEGMKRSVEAVLLVHIHRHPHILLMQIGGNFVKLYATIQLSIFKIQLHSFSFRCSLMCTVLAARSNPVKMKYLA
jgi:hypothetical protein